MKTQRGFWSFLLLALLLAGCRTPPAARTAAANKHSLWTVKGQHATVYLLGSVHVLKPSDYPLAAPIETAFSNAAVVVFETDIDKLQGAGAQLELLSKGSLPPGQTLAGAVSPALYNQFTNRAAQAGLPLFLVQRLQPALAAFMLQAFQLLQLGLDPDAGVDVRFHKLARAQHKTIIPLETVAFQENLVTSFSKEEGELILKSALDEFDTMAKEWDQMLKAWKVGNDRALDQLLNSMRREAPAVFKRLVTDRTASWVPKVMDLARGDKNAIVIVGAGHLVGKAGLVQLLRKKGFKVTQD
jgi:hypothetical protein